MKRPQIHLYLTPHLFTVLKQRAQGYGLSPAQYVKYSLVKDLEAYFPDVNVKKKAEDLYEISKRLFEETKH